MTQVTKDTCQIKVWLHRPSSKDHLWVTKLERNAVVHSHYHLCLCKLIWISLLLGLPYLLERKGHLEIIIFFKIPLIYVKKLFTKRTVQYKLYLHILFSWTNFLSNPRNVTYTNMKLFTWHILQLPLRIKLEFPSLLEHTGCPLIHLLCIAE